MSTRVINQARTGIAGADLSIKLAKDAGLRTAVTVTVHPEQHFVESDRVMVPSQIVVVVRITPPHHSGRQDSECLHLNWSRFVGHGRKGRFMGGMLRRPGMTRTITFPRHIRPVIEGMRIAAGQPPAQ